MMAKSHTENKLKQNTKNKKHLKKIARRYSFSLSNVMEK
jgi:hypothetical protein